MSTTGAPAGPAAVATSPLGPDDPRQVAIRLVARREVPVALAITGAIVLVVGGINVLTSGNLDAREFIPDAVLGTTLLVLAAVLRRYRSEGSLVHWVYATSMTLVVAWLLNEFRDQPDTANMAYVVIVIATFGPVVLAWVPFIAAAASMAAGAIAVLTSTGWGDLRGWTAACLVAMAVGALFLQIRLRSLSELADAKAVIERLATTDPLTGLLNRHGLDVFSGGLVANATRHGQPLVVWFIDIDGLKAANDRFGHEFGDDVIRVVADAVKSCAREGDLVARWGGDEFLVLGLGIEPRGGTLAHRITERITAAGLGHDRWCGAVSIGTSSRMPQTTTIEDLISEADAQMYRKRDRV